MTKQRELTLQIYNRKRDADQACSIFWNAGFNYNDIEVRDYSTVKVKIVDPKKVKEEGGFWSIYGGGEKQWTNNFQVGDIGYVCVAKEHITKIVSCGLSILEVETGDSWYPEYLTPEQYSRLKQRKENLERALKSYTCYSWFNEKSPQEIESLKESWKIEINSIDKIFEDNKSRILSWSLHQEEIKNES